MRTKYRFYACPEDKCPKLSTRADTYCPTHEDKQMVEVILVREDTIQKLKDAAERVHKAGEKVAGRNPDSPMAKTIDDALRSVTDILKGTK